MTGFSGRLRSCAEVGDQQVNLDSSEHCIKGSLSLDGTGIVWFELAIAQHPRLTLRARDRRGKRTIAIRAHLDDQEEMLRSLADSIDPEIVMKVFSEIVQKSLATVDG